MNNSKRITLLLLTLIIAVSQAIAFDFSAQNAEGSMLYFNRLNDKEAELTYAERFKPTASYLEHVIIPSTVTDGSNIYTVSRIGERALYNCREIIEITVPSSVTEIGMWAFAWCDGATKIQLPNTIEAIGANAFEGCYALTEIDVKGTGNITEHNNALYSSDYNTLISYTPGAEGEYIVADGTKTIGDNAFAACTYLTSLTLPPTLIKIRENAFYFCNNLSKVNIPANVTEIGYAAFMDCSSLEAIDVDADNNTYKSIDGVLFDHEVQRLIQSPGASGALAVLPDGLKMIGEEAFMRNYGLTTVKIPETLNTISMGAFLECPRLASVEIPASVTTINDMAFALCSDLTSLYVNNPEPESITLGENVFIDVDKDKCVLYVPANSENAYREAKQWSDFHNILAFEGHKEQQIVWEEKSDTIKSDNEIILSAKSTSNLPVRYILTLSSQQIASLSNNNHLSVNLPGEVTVIAYQPGNIEYAPAIPVAHTYISKVSFDEEISLTESEIKVYGAIGSIIIKGASDDAISYVYNINGQLIARDTRRTIPIDQPGIYIVSISGHSYKVAVR